MFQAETVDSLPSLTKLHFYDLFKYVHEHIYDIIG